jgi:hypothetical protein
MRDGSLTWVERRGALWWAMLANHDPPRSSGVVTVLSIPEI